MSAAPVGNTAELEERAGGRLRGGAMVLAAACLWGTMGIFARMAYAHGAEPLETVSARAALAFLGLAVLHLHRPRRLSMPAGELPFFALFGAVSIALFYWLYFAALQRVPVGVAAALLYTAPVFAVLLARVFFGEALTARKLLALAAALMGVLLVTGAGGAVLGAGGTPRAGTWPEGALAGGGLPVTAAGVLLGLGAGLTYALFTLFGKRATARHDAVRTVFWALGFGALFLGILVPPWRVLLEHPGAIPAVLALSLLSTLAANLLYIGGLLRLEAGVAALLATVEPVVAALLAWVWLGEGLGAGQVGGIVLIVAGAAWLLGRGRAAQGDPASGARERTEPLAPGGPR